MTDSPTYLDTILAAKRKELRGRTALPRDRELQDLLAALAPPRDLALSLRDPHDITVIAEFKRASPSEGDIAPGADPRTVATKYVEAGARAISVLTDVHFKGTLEDLRAVRSAVSVPILRKDFILERSQILEARVAGADAVLLIVAALEPPRLRQLIEFAHNLSLSVLCEAHTAHEVDRALSAGAKIIGVNARNLRTFEVDLSLHETLRALVPRSFVYVAESGIRSREDVRRLRKIEVDGVLVGTHLMREPDPGAALAQLRKIGP